MKTFTDKELRLIGKLRDAAEQTTLELREPCPNHSACIPFPLFRVYRRDADGFEAEWNDFHRAGPRQQFLFAEALEAGASR
jgi:hypothetical protein